MFITQIQKNPVAPKFTGIAIIKGESNNIIDDIYQAKQFVKDVHNIESAEIPLPRYCKSKIKQELLQDGFDYPKDPELKQAMINKTLESFRIIATGDDIKPLKKAANDVYQFKYPLDSLKKFNDFSIIKEEHKQIFPEYSHLQQEYSMNILPIEKNVNPALALCENFKGFIKESYKEAVENAQKGLKYLTEKVADLPVYTLEEFKEIVTSGKFKP